MKKAVSILVFALICLCAYNQEENDFQYKYISYDEIINMANEFATKYPRYIRLFNAKNDSNLRLPSTNCGNTQCDHIYFQISDFSQPRSITNSLPQTLIVGAIHGDERLSGLIPIYLTKFILENVETSPHISYLVKNRLIVILPIANPSGYKTGIREETQNVRNEKVFVDINRDFSYNVEARDCMISAGGRVINYIFKTHMIQSAISFHGGLNSITYPWGGFNHAKKKSFEEYIGFNSPDHNAFESISQYLLRQSGPNNKDLDIRQYDVGLLNSVVYPVNGGLEDWAYAGSWENKYNGNNNPPVIPVCTMAPEEMTKYTDADARAMLYLVETDDLKYPPAERLGSQNGVLSRSPKQFGHVPRNIALSLALIEASEAYIKNVSTSYQNKTLEVMWQAGGCMSVNETWILWNTFQSKERRNRTETWNVTDYLKLGYRETPKQTGPSSTWNSTFWFTEKIKLPKTEYVDVIVLLSCDSIFAEPNSPVPNTEPQSHLVRARTWATYNARNGNFSISSRAMKHHRVKEINAERLNYLEELNQAINKITLRAELTSCDKSGQGEPIGYLTAVFKNKAEHGIGSNELFLSSNFSIKNVSLEAGLEAYLYQYAETGACSAKNLGKQTDFNNFGFDSSEEYCSQKRPILQISKETLKNEGFVSKVVLKNEDVAADIIGRSVGLSVKDSHRDRVVYRTVLLPEQPDSCLKEGKNCFGFRLNYLEEVSCQIMSKSTASNIPLAKLFLSRSINGDIKAKAYLNNYIDDVKEDVDGIKVKIGAFEEYLPLYKNKTSKMLFSHGEEDIDLDPNLIVGNVAHLFLASTKSKTENDIGFCNITRKNPDSEEFDFYKDEFPVVVINEETGLLLIVIYLLIGLSIILILSCAYTLRLKRKQDKEARRLFQIHPEVIEQSKSEKIKGHDRFENTPRQEVSDLTMFDGESHR